MLSKYQFISSGKAKKVSTEIKDFGKYIYLEAVKLEVYDRNDFGVVDRDAIKESLTKSLINFRDSLAKQAQNEGYQVSHFLVNCTTLNHLTRNSDYIGRKRITIKEGKKEKIVERFVMLSHDVMIDENLKFLEIVPVVERKQDKTFKKRFINEL